MRTSYKLYEDYDYYFVTCTIINWVKVFSEDKYCQLIIGSLKYCQKHKGLHLYYDVIMPDHLHLIISTTQGKVSDFIRDFKRFTSKEITKLLVFDRNDRILNIFKKVANPRHYTVQLCNEEEEKIIRYRVWQTGYHPKAITTYNMLNQKMEYIHMNPVEDVLVDEPEQWKYSSAKNFYLNDNSIIKLEDIGM